MQRGGRGDLDPQSGCMGAAPDDQTTMTHAIVGLSREYLLQLQLKTMPDLKIYPLRLIHVQNNLDTPTLIPSVYNNKTKRQKFKQASIPR